MEAPAHKDANACCLRIARRPSQNVEALGVAVSELRAYLQRRAAGLPAELATDNNEYNALDKADCRGPEAVPATLSEWATVREVANLLRSQVFDEHFTGGGFGCALVVFHAG